MTALLTNHTPKRFSRGPAPRLLRALPYLVLAVVLAALLVTRSQVGATSEREPALRIATTVWPGYEPLYLARDSGAFGETDVRLVERISATGVASAFRNHAVDMAAMTLNGALQLAADGVDLRIVLMLDTSAGADAVLARPGIGSLGELRGKRIGVETRSIGGYVLARALKRAGLSEEDVTIVPLDTSEHVAAYARGRVDAVATWEPMRSAVLDSGGREIFTSAEIPGEIADVLVARPEVVAARGEELADVAAGWFASVRRLEQTPLDAARSMAPRERISADRFLDSLVGLEVLGAQPNRSYLLGSTPLIVRTIERVQKVMVVQGRMDRRIDPRELVDPRMATWIEARA